MLSFPRKKSEASASLTPPWQPNFRNFKELPDTKTVRTAFFVNGVALVVVSALLLWFVYQEYQIKELQREVASWQSQIDRDRAGSEQAIALYKKFQAAAARVEEVNAFVTSKPAVSDLLIEIGQGLPRAIALESFEIRSTGLRLLAVVHGSPDAASGYASGYLEQLKTQQGITRWFEDAALLNVNRNPQTGQLTVEYALKLKAVAGKAGKK